MDELYCPYCGSTQLTAHNQGFGVGKAAAGAILTGGVGLLAGFIGSGKIKVTCLKCGKKMNAGDLYTSPPKRISSGIIIPSENYDKHLEYLENNQSENSNSGCIGTSILLIILAFILIWCSVYIFCDYNIVYELFN